MIRPDSWELKQDPVLPPIVTKRLIIEDIVTRARAATSFLTLLQPQIGLYTSPDDVPAICYRDERILKTIVARSKMMLGGHGFRREQISLLMEEPLESLPSAIYGLLQEQVA